jgi:hypothetical protein
MILESGSDYRAGGRCLRQHRRQRFARTPHVALQKAGRMRRRGRLRVFVVPTAALAVYLALAAYPPVWTAILGALFPEESRLLYERTSMLGLIAQHLSMVALASVFAVAFGLALGIFVTRPAGQRLLRRRRRSRESRRRPFRRSRYLHLPSRSSAWASSHRLRACRLRSIACAAEHHRRHLRRPRRCHRECASDGHEARPGPVESRASHRSARDLCGSASERHRRSGDSHHRRDHQRRRTGGAHHLRARQPRSRDDASGRTARRRARPDTRRVSRRHRKSARGERSRLARRWSHIARRDKIYQY